MGSAGQLSQFPYDFDAVRRDGVIIGYAMRDPPLQQRLLCEKRLSIDWSQEGNVP